jgi:hypothetical protein
MEIAQLLKLKDSLTRKKQRPQSKKKKKIAIFLLDQHQRISIGIFVLIYVQIYMYRSYVQIASRRTTDVDGKNRTSASRCNEN